MAIKWTETETWSLIAQIKAGENFKVLYGQAANENSSGDTKNAVHQRIAAALWPGENGDMSKMAGRVKNRIIWLEKTFKEKVKLLKKTGEGVEEWYHIASTGPDHDTDRRAVSIWDRIANDFKYFPDLYRVWSTKPNLVPICATTGIGPKGSEFVLIQQSPEKGQTTPSTAQPAIMAPSQPPPVAPAVSMLGQSSSFNSSFEHSEGPPIPLSTPSAPYKENNRPPPSTQRPPRSSAFASLGSPVNGDKAPVTIPPKVGFEDKMIGLQQDMMKNMTKRSDEAQSLKRLREERKTEDQRLKRQRLLQSGLAQLLAEFQAGVWTAEEYRKERNKVQVSFSTPKKLRRRSSTPPPREPSPDWDEDFLNADIEGEEL
ncbi:hypothetical protein FB446DRAFT_238756 [Lentinula raphanica]|nr:hypothetical protein FB446DRAFT_238756 [Lentinula raphanica]